MIYFCSVFNQGFKISIIAQALEIKMNVCFQYIHFNLSVTLLWGSQVGVVVISRSSHL